jgi:hypothetical protein
VQSLQVSQLQSTDSWSIPTAHQLPASVIQIAAPVPLPISPNSMVFSIVGMFTEAIGNCSGAEIAAALLFWILNKPRTLFQRLPSADRSSPSAVFGLPKLSGNLLRTEDGTDPGIGFIIDSYAVRSPISTHWLDPIFTKFAEDQIDLSLFPGVEFTEVVPGEAATTVVCPVFL